MKAFSFSKKSGLEVLKYGYDRASIRKAFNLPYDELPKTIFSENTSDAFGDTISIVSYDKDNYIKSIEFYYPGTEFFFEGEQVLGIKTLKLKGIFKKLGYIFDYSGDFLGPSIEDGNIRLYIPDYKEEGDNAKVKSFFMKVK